MRVVGRHITDLRYDDLQRLIDDGVIESETLEGAYLLLGDIRDGQLELVHKMDRQLTAARGRERGGGVALDPRTDPL